MRGYRKYRLESGIWKGIPEMKIEIINDKKLNWSYVKKAMLKLTTDSLNYEEPLTIQDITRLHFVTGQLLQDYYCEGKK